MLASGYFSALYNLTNVRDQSAAAGIRFRNNTQTDFNSIVNTLYIQNLRLQGQGSATDITGLPGNNTGWNGFALVKYLGPQDPAQWNHGNTYNTWLGPLIDHSQTTGTTGNTWREALWAALNPIVPSGAGIYHIHLYVMMETTVASWQRYHMTNVTSVERQADGAIILWGHVHHPWSANTTGDTFSALRITNNGAQLQRRTNAGVWDTGTTNRCTGTVAGTLIVRG